MKNFLIVGVVLFVLLSLAAKPSIAQAKKDEAKPAETVKTPPVLTEVETLKLQVAQKDLVIAQLQNQVTQLSARVIQSEEMNARLKMSATRDEISKAHKGMQVQFKPDGTPMLVAVPSPAPAPVKTEKSK